MWVTHRALARTHGCGRIPLQDRRRLIALGPRVFEIAHRDIFTGTDEAGTGRRRQFQLLGGVCAAAHGPTTTFDSFIDGAARQHNLPGPDYRLSTPLPQQSVPGTQAERQDEGVAGDRFPPGGRLHGDRLHALMSPYLGHTPVLDYPESVRESGQYGGRSHNRRYLDTGRHEVFQMFGTLGCLSDEDNVAAGQDVVRSRKSGGATPEPNAYSIASFEYGVLLHGSSRHHDTTGVDEMQEIRAVDGHQGAFVDADRRCALQQGHVGLGAHRLQQRVDLLLRCSWREFLANDSLLGENHRPTFFGCSQRGGKSGNTGTGNKNVGVVAVTLAMGGRLVVRYGAEPDEPPDHVIHHRPQELRPYEGLVVEAHREESPQVPE